MRKYGQTEVVYDPDLQRGVERLLYMTDEEKAIAEMYNKPCSYDLICKYLKRLASYKRIAGGDDEIKFRIRDTANRLKGVTEPFLFLACNRLIEEDESEWFPQPSKLKKLCGMKNDDH